LDANESTVYQADDEGSYPIHAAALSNSLDVVKMLLERCPDCATLRDGQGRTFLHVAAEKSCYDVVQYVCGEMPQQLSSWKRMILNAQDSNGDTALHGAVRDGNLAIFNCLFRNREVRLDVVNKDGMAPLDLSWTMIPSGITYAFVSRHACIYPIFLIFPFF
jgi:ankyrin repeat protein